ncbi:MAG TPA: gephyrin-like molybdotransferase Glp, partial [Mycobacteriales bacterium]|nr:gephyrin-like molybdotransferase Glp [Mycobacteriales bacterium]
MTQPGGNPTVEEFLAAVLGVVQPLAALPVSLADGQGCLLAEDVTAPWPLPTEPLAQADGYALRSADLAGLAPGAPVQLAVVGQVRAGESAAQLVVQPGCAVRVYAGGSAPAGADVVVPLAWTDGAPGRVSIRQAPPPPGWLRAAGSDLAAGAAVLSRGTVLGGAHAGLLAAVGRSQVLVQPRPRVVIVSTAPGLVEAGQVPGPGQTIDSGSHLVAAAVRDAGGVAFRVGVLPDDPVAMYDALEDHLIRADLVIATGGGGPRGASHGDTVAEVLGRLGTVRASRVRVHPGGSFAVGQVGPDRVPFLGVPGYPVSAYLALHLFARPAIRVLAGMTPEDRTVGQATLGQALSSPAGLRQLVPVRIDAAGVATPAAVPGMHPLGVLGSASAVAIIADDAT